MENELSIDVSKRGELVNRYLVLFTFSTCSKSILVSDEIILYFIKSFFRQIKNFRNRKFQLSLSITYCISSIVKKGDNE